MVASIVQKDLFWNYLYLEYLKQYTYMQIICIKNSYLKL